MPRLRTTVLAAVAVLAAAAAAVPHVASAGTAPVPPAPHRPVVFVHGSAGSAEQFQTQAKRLASNGYPIAAIEAHEYDSPRIQTIIQDVYAGLDARIDRLLAATGADKVDLAAHSLGTFVSQGYLNSSPARAARVAHYVNLDGRIATALPGGVPTLAIWGEGDQTRSVTGATNVYQPDQSHTQTVSSVESFKQIFTFFRGHAPRTVAILPEPPSKVRVSGRAVIFPSNEGITGATVEVFPVDRLTGRRIGKKPQHTVTLGEGGAFGPLAVRPDSRYEFSLVRAGVVTHHFYYQPFVRSDSFVRLLAGRPGEGLGAKIETGDKHTAVTVSRQKEFWGDQGDAGDRLWVNGKDIINAANAPRVKRIIGIFAFDAGVDGVTDLTAPLPAFFGTTFITGMDVFIPAAPANRGVVSIVTAQRGGGHESHTVPNWPSSGHRVTVSFSDH